jgi:YD repeat-containing protein
MRLKYFLIGFLAWLTFSTNSSFADVLPKSGVFTVEYTDISYSGGLEPRIVRSYSSNLAYKGIFGRGWAIEYEVSLETKDDKIVIHDQFEARDYFFTPDKESKVYVPMMVNAILRAAKADTDRNSPSKEGKAVSLSQQASRQSDDSLQLKLLNDPELRETYWQKYLKLKLVSFLDLPLRSNFCGCQRLQRVEGGYRRELSGHFELFDNAGRLIKIFNNNNNWVEISYDKDGKISRISDNYKRTLNLIYDPANDLVRRIEGSQGTAQTPNRLAEYIYGMRGELIRSKGDDGEIYEYQYDFNYKITRIIHKDKTTIEITYNEDMNGRVRMIKDRDGTTTQYRYSIDKANPLHITITLDTFGTDRKVISKATYDYISEKNQHGDEITVKKIVNIGGDITETEYDLTTSFPKSVRRGSEETKFEYWDGLVTKKITSVQVTELEYDKGVRKVARVISYPMGKPTENKWSEFKYDEKGNLLLARNSDGKLVKVDYDYYGRVATLADQDKRILQFKYNEDSKPIEITDASLGTIKITYTERGEISKVDSPSGRKIALQVTSAFQNLLDVIRPAGVTFSF